MTSFADIKTAVLAALIVLSAVICGQNDDMLADVQTTAPHATIIELPVLTG